MFAHWGSLADRLEAAGVLSTVHGESLAVLVRTWRDCEAVRTAIGKLEADAVDVPLFRLSEQLSARLLRMLAEFGLTPASQSKVQAHPDAHGVDAFESFLRGKAG
jgi:hypothetical protein